jgi:hypothetical protein
MNSSKGYGLTALFVCKHKKKREKVWKIMLSIKSKQQNPIKQWK